MCNHGVRGPVLRLIWSLLLTVTVGLDHSFMCATVSAAACLQDARLQEAASQSLPVTAIALSTDEKLLLIANHQGLAIREIPGEPKDELRAFEADQISALEFSPNGSLLAVAGGTPGQFGLVEILEWPVCKRSVINRDFDEVCTAIAWSPDGRYVAAGCHDSTIRVLDVATGNTAAKIESHSRAITGLVWTTMEDRPDSGTVLISSSLDQSIRLFAPTTTETGISISPLRALNQHTREVQGIAVAGSKQRFQNDRLTLVSWGDDRTLRFWQPLTGRMMRFAKLESDVVDAVWDGSGRFVIAALANGEIVAVSMETAAVAPFMRFDQPITKLTFRTSTDQLIASDFRGQIHFRSAPQTPQGN